MEARCCFFGVCEHLSDFRKVLSVNQDRPFVFEKTLEATCVGLTVEWGGVSGNHGAECLQGVGSAKEQ